jgi:hypothetical protein
MAASMQPDSLGITPCRGRHIEDIDEKLTEFTRATRNIIEQRPLSFVSGQPPVVMANHRDAAGGRGHDVVVTVGREGLREAEREGAGIFGAPHVREGLTATRLRRRKVHLATIVLK